MCPVNKHVQTEHGREENWSSCNSHHQGASPPWCMRTFSSTICLARQRKGLQVSAGKSNYEIDQMPCLTGAPQNCGCNHQLTRTGAWSVATMMFGTFSHRSFAVTEFERSHLGGRRLQEISETPSCLGCLSFICQRGHTRRVREWPRTDLTRIFNVRWPTNMTEIVIIKFDLKCTHLMDIKHESSRE